METVKQPRKRKANLDTVLDEHGHPVRVYYLNGRIFFRRPRHRRVISVPVSDTYFQAIGQFKLL